MSESIAEKKAVLRRTLRETLRALSITQQSALSAQLSERLLQQPLWPQWQTVLFFVPIVGEPNLLPALKAALASKKAVILPSYQVETSRYQGRQITDIERDLETGQFGIAEPSPGCPVFDLKRLDLVLVPGIGFTLDGGRLGRGKGFYDRLLSEVSGLKCGVGFDCQFVDALPLEPHDVRLNCILTPTRWHDVRARS